MAGNSGIRFGSVGTVMKIRKNSLFTPVLLLLATGVHAQGSDELKQQVLAVDERFAQAVISNDHAAMEDILAEHAVIVTSTGRVSNHIEKVDSIRNGESQLTRVAIDSEEVYLHGDTAVVSEKLHAQGVAQTDPIDHWIQVTRVYIQRDGEWKLISYHSTRVAEGEAN